MRMFAKFVIGGIIAGALCFVYDMTRQYLRGRPEPTMRVELATDEQVKTVVTPSRIETLERTREGTVRHTAEPNYHHGHEVVTDSKGNTKLLQKTRGFSDDFGLSTDFRRIGVAMEPVFYKNFHGLVGMHFIDLRTGKLDLDMYVAIAYRIPYSKFNNTSVYGGVDTDRHLIGGLFLRFGNS